MQDLGYRNTLKILCNLIGIEKLKLVKSEIETFEFGKGFSMRPVNGELFVY